MSPLAIALIVAVCTLFLGCAANMIKDALR